MNVLNFRNFVVTEFVKSRIHCIWTFGHVGDYLDGTEFGELLIGVRSPR